MAFNEPPYPAKFGGTGTSTTPTDGQIPIGSTSSAGYTPAAITAGTGITIANAAGSITITAPGVGTGTLGQVAAYTGANTVAGISNAQLNNQCALGGFVSGLQTLSTSSVLSVAHLLGYTPTLLFAVMHCVTANDGYVAGDEFPIFPSGGDGANGLPGFNMRADGTNVYLATAALAISLVPKAGGTPIAVTAADWNIRLCAR